MKIKVIKNKTNSKLDILGRSIAPKSILLTNIVANKQVLSRLGKSYATHYTDGILVIAYKSDIITESDIAGDGDIIKHEKVSPDTQKKSKANPSQTKKKGK